MQVEIRIDGAYPEPKVVILTAAVTEEVSQLAKKLSGDAPCILSGMKDGKVEVLEPADLIRVYTSAGKVYAVTEKGEYVLRLRLYEAEQRLNPHQFVRISNSEIINLKMAKRFDLSFSGTICVNLAGGQTAYVSRRYVAKIKRLLGI